MVACLAKTKAQAPLLIPTNLLHSYQSATRSATGQPGGAYWQNRADYDIAIEFDPKTRTIKGSVTIDYQNNSPDTLRRLLFKLYPNLYQQQAIRSVYIAPEDLGTGVLISSIRINDQQIDSGHRKIKGTNMNLTGVEVPPHGKARVTLKYSYVLNKGSFIRTGQIDTGSFFIAYFFPRITVYDDVDGWNEYPYTGQYEFYNDYGDFRLAITVPASYLVWATGELENAAAVYQPVILERLKKALQSDTVTNIVAPGDWQTGEMTRGSVTNQWIFTAKNVTDVAIALSNHYNWRSAGIVVDSLIGHRVRVDAVYNPGHPEYARVAGYARKTVELIDQRLPGIPFPYPHITVVDGLDAMEYPMMVNDLPFKDPADAIEFTAHEVFHSLFPFMVGINETKYSFMDEGLATMTEFTFHPLIDSTIPVGNNTGDVNRAAGTEQDLPIMTLTPQLLGTARYADKDMKPALGFYYLREMLGEQRFNQALKYFIQNWAGKHPTPYDFFNCMNKGAGQNLNWFWDNWFFHKYVPDLAISGVTLKGPKASVTIRRKGEAMVPVHLTIHYADGAIKHITKTIACWSAGNRSVKIPLPAGSEIVSIKLGAPFDADSDPGNNSWKTQATSVILHRSKHVLEFGKGSPKAAITEIHDVPRLARICPRQQSRPVR